MGFRIKVKWDNQSLRTAHRQLRRLEEGIRKRVVVKATRSGGKVALRIARVLVPVEDATDSLSRARRGLLRKSMGIRIAVYKQSGVVLAVIGPRRGFKRAIGIRTRGKHKGLPVFADPAKYAHLVEYGTRRSRARPFMRPALAAARGPAIEAMIRVIRDGVIEELGRV